VETVDGGEFRRDWGGIGGVCFRLLFATGRSGFV